MSFDPRVYLDREIVLLVEIDAYDPDTDTVVQLLFSDASARGRGRRYNGKIYPSIVVNALRIKSGIVQKTFQIESSELSSLGSVRLAWPADQSLDHVAHYYFDGRTLRLLIGLPDDDYADFKQVFEGVILNSTWNEQFLEFNLKNRAGILDIPIQTNVYAGNGGALSYDNNSELAGVIKPLTYGSVRNAELRYVNSSYEIFQFHDGAAQAVTAIYDKGVMLAKANGGSNDISQMGLADVFAWVPVPGEYITDLSRGIVRLGAKPVGTITGDVSGDNADPNVGFVETAPHLFRRIITLKGGLTVQDFDNTEINNLAVSRPYKVGYFIRDQQQIKDVVDDILDSAFCFWTVDRNGLLRVGAIEIGTPVATIADHEIVSFASVEVDPPARRLTFGYSRCWTIQEGDDLVASVPASHQSAVSNEYRLTIAADAAVLTKHKLATDLRINSFLSNAAEAIAVRDLRFNLIKTIRRRINVSVIGHSWELKPGDTVTLYNSRWYSAGKDFLILGIEEETDTGNTLLLLWG